MAFEDRFRGATWSPSASRPSSCTVAHKARSRRFQPVPSQSAGNICFETVKVRACIEPLAEFDEHVYYRPLKTKPETEHKDPWRERDVEGFWVGCLFRSTENLIVTASGIQKAGVIRSQPPGERCSPSLLDAEKNKIPWLYGVDIHKIASYVRPDLVGEEQPLQPE